MQPNSELAGNNAAVTSCQPMTPDGMEHPESCVEAGVPEGFRRLQWNEVVCLGDFIMDVQHGFQLWDGPRGFRADAFVKPTYRRAAGRR